MIEATVHCLLQLTYSTNVSVSGGCRTVQRKPFFNDWGQQIKLEEGNENAEENWGCALVL